MCQDEIEKYLRRKGKVADMKDLMINIPANRTSISRACKKMRERNEIGYTKQKERNYEKFVYFI